MDDDPFSFGEGGGDPLDHVDLPWDSLPEEASYLDQLGLGELSSFTSGPAGRTSFAPPDTSTGDFTQAGPLPPAAGPSYQGYQQLDSISAVQDEDSLMVSTLNSYFIDVHCASSP